MSTTTYVDTVQPIFPIVRNQEGQLVHQTPEALHPANIKGNSGAAEYARQVMASTSQSLARFNTMWVRRDEKLHGEVKNFKLGEFDNAKADFKKEIKRIEDGLIEKANLKPNAAYITAICGVFHSMKPEQRANAVRELVEAGDGPTLAVLDEAPIVLTGLSREVHATIRPQIFAKTDPNGFAQLNMERANYDKVEAALNARVIALGKFAQKPDVASNSEPELIRSVASNN